MQDRIQVEQGREKGAGWSPAGGYNHRQNWTETRGKWRWGTRAEE